MRIKGNAVRIHKLTKDTLEVTRIQSPTLTLEIKFGLTDDMISSV
jgi:hypothetical protein